MREIVIMTVRITLRNPVPRGDLRQYVKEAVECWGGQFHPDDPLFNGVELVTTRIIREKADA